MIELAGLDVNYGAQKVLDTITLEAKKGVFVGIIGPNGSGKTTLLKAISRVITPSGGIIRLDGLPVADLSSREFARSVAVVPQDTHAGFDFTVRDVVLMGRYPHLNRFSRETEADLAACDRAMALTGITHLSGRSINAISGGELQRTIIARALAQEPRHLLLDEATSHLDISHQVDILTTIKQLSTEIAVIGVFHDLNLAAYFCDEIIVLKNGKIEAAGTPAVVITPKTLHDVFDIDASVSVHPVTGKPLVVLLPQSQEIARTNHRVHVISGGGTGAEIIRVLHRAGCRVTTGVLAMNDTDYAAATELGIACITEPPFSPITERSTSALAAQIREADVVVLTAAPVGAGNLDNLRILAEADDTPVLFLSDDGRAEVPDYTNGKAGAFLDSMKGSGRLTVVSGHELVNRCTGGNYK
ncbi:MAG TPA: ABC transporter ATP-binding protein [Methanoregula sp.]|nr:ABC transporter ATP-binding protein [Methanoregula sp.]